jgi:hypothetical protein
VICALAEAVSATSGVLYLDWGERRHLVGTATISGNELRFDARRPRGKLVLHVQGHHPVSLSWTTQDANRSCAPDPLVLVARDEMTLTGRVLNTAGNPEPDAQVVGCGPAKVGQDGHFSVSPVRAPCTIQAIRQDGFWFSRSEHEDVPWLPGGDYDLDLVLNEYPRGGLGITIGVSEDGIVVNLVHEDTPAAAAGLVKGDLIVALEGEPTAGMPLEDFVDRATGEAGTDVTIEVVGADGRERELTLNRAMLGP